MRHSTGRAAAWVVGHAVTESGVLLRQAEPIALAPGITVESFAQSLNGRFVVVDLGPADPIVYPDGCCSLGAVHAGAEESVASTSGLIPVSRATPFAIDRIISTDIPYRASMYPLGITPRIGVERLRPNHRLDCGSWAMVRTWPLEAVQRGPDTAAFESYYAASVQRTLRAIAGTYELDFALTGGGDTRLMLACSSGIPAPVTTFTAALDNLSGWSDTQVAGRLAAHLGVEHRVIRARSRRKDLLHWAQRTACETGEPNGWRGARALADQRKGRATITGITTDVVRFDEARQIALVRGNTPEEILRRCNISRRPEFVARARQWLDGLGHLDAVTIADLVHIEQRHGCWSAVIEYGELGDSSARLSPTTSAGIIRGGLALPHEYRIERKLHRAVIAATWPEALEVPFDFEEGGRPGAWIKRYYRMRSRLQRAIEVNTSRVRRRVAKARARDV